MKGRNIKIISAILFAVSLFLLVFCLFDLLYQHDNKYTSGPPYGEKGVFTFTEEDLNRPLFLIDGWEFYPDQSYHPDDFTKGDTGTPQYTFIGQYSNFSYLQKEHSPFGEATYRIVLRNNDGPQVLELEIPEIFTQYTLWIDGRQAATRGNGVAVSFILNNESEIVLNTENHTHYYSGLYYPPAFGKPEIMDRMFFWRILFYSILCISSLTLALFASTLWLGRKNQDAMYYHFGMLCLAFFISCSHFFVWQAGLSSLFWYALEGAAQVAVVMQAVELSALAAEVSQRRWYRTGVRPTLIVVCLFCFVTVLFIIPAFGKTVNLYGYFVDLCKIVCWIFLAICAAKGLQHSRRYGWFVLAGSCVLGASRFVNLLDNNRFEPIYTGWQSEYAGFILVLIFGGLMVFRNWELLEQNCRMTSHLEELVQTRTNELSAVLEERKNFFSDMAHNLKAPIAAVHGFISLIREQNLYLDEELQSYLNLIDRENLEIRKRVQALNVLNAFDRISQPMETLDINEILKQVYRENSPDADAVGIFLEVNYLEKSVSFIGQSEKVLTLFENLIQNAISFTGTGGKIVIHAEQDDNKLKITVSDTGKGIKQEQLHHIFERFYTSRQNSGEGSGLGLYIVKMTVEEMGGRITVESKEEKGAKFTILLPLR